MNLSCCTFIKDAIYNDLPIDLWIQQHSSIFPDVVVVDTGSQDGTYEMISEYDIKSNVRIMRIPIEDKGDNDWFRECKVAAINQTKYNAVLFLDADEFIHEDEAPYIFQRAQMMFQRNVDYGLSYRQFIGNLFTQIHGLRFGYYAQNRLFRKDKEYTIHVDGANFWNKNCMHGQCPAKIWHYGYVRDPKSIGWKTHIQKNRFKDHDEAAKTMKEGLPKDRKPYIPQDLLEEPRWKVLGKFPKVVRENPERFFKFQMDDIDSELMVNYK